MPVVPMTTKSPNGLSVASVSCEWPSGAAQLPIAWRGNHEAALSQGEHAMSHWFNNGALSSSSLANVLGSAPRTALAAPTLSLAMLLATAVNAAAADEPTTAPRPEVAPVECTEQESNETSLVVATCEDETAAVPSQEKESALGSITSDAALDESNGLEPISQSSEPTPELADEVVAAPQDLEPQQEQAAQAAEKTEPAAKEETPAFTDALAKVSRSSPTGTNDSTKKAPKLCSHRTEGNISREPVQFQGITAGTSTESDLVSIWGEPSDSIDSDEGKVLAYDIKPFSAVDVLIDSTGVVSAIKVELAEAIKSDTLAEQLSLSDIASVTVDDETGRPMGEAFPERGVLFMYAELSSASLHFDETSPNLVSHVVVQPLDARAFVLRAQGRPRGHFEKYIDDLTTAVALEPENAQAHWLLAGMYLEIGQADSAVREATAACELGPNVAMYQLRRGQALEVLGEYDEAVHTTRAVLDRHDIEPMERALALHDMARLASLGDVQIASKAIPFDSRAIEIADRVATTKDDSTRRMAKQLLVEAHLAVAEEISRQAFNQKVESLSLWVGRASGLAEECIENDGGNVELRLLIAQRALAALANFKPTLDPGPWVTEAEEATRTLAAQSDDTLWQQHIKWQLGIAYLHALRVEHLRREATSALRYGQLAVDNLAEGASSRQAVHSSEQLVAQLYFHMGAVHAVLRQDHAKALPWYEKAIPLLTGPRPVSELYSPRREGEMLVSIGVTCWQIGQQTKALEVTRSGTNLVEMAVEDGILAKTSLAVPYGNLATMYNQMGESTNSAKYLELVRSIKGPGSAGETKVAGANAAGQSARALQTTAQQPTQTRLR